MAYKDINEVILTGRLVRDPELRYTAKTQIACARFSLAVSKGQGKDGDLGASFPAVICWGPLAELTDRYLSKGSFVTVHGCLETRSYDRKGQTIYVTEVRAADIKFSSKNNTPNNTPIDEKAAPTAADITGDNETWGVQQSIFGFDTAEDIDF